MIDWCSRRWFSLFHGSSLVYNACWEDPRIDCEALSLGEDDTLLTITSAGCNALDFALEGTGRVYAVDVNPRQTALLELKLAGIRELDYDTFFALFGDGKLADFPALYRRRLRPRLSAASAAIWDRQLGYFAPSSSFYFRGGAGLFARAMGGYIDVTRVRELVHSLFAADSLDEQRYLYENFLKKAFWTRFLRAVIDWDLPFSLLGVPRAQRLRIEKDHGGVCDFLESCLDAVFGALSLRDNYFWWLYVNGAYSKDRCPRYLEPESFAKLKGGLVDRVTPSTESIAAFLKRGDAPITRFVLLDHMDWLRDTKPELLREEWQLLLERASPEARFLWRSAGSRGDFVDDLPVTRGRARHRVGDALRYDGALADRLQTTDRVHTYGNLSIATLAPGWAHG